GGLPHRRQDGHGVEVRGGRLLGRRVRVHLRRARAGQRSAARDRGDDRRAARRLLLRVRRRRPGVRGGAVGIAAAARGAAGCTAGARSEQRDTGDEPMSMPAMDLTSAPALDRLLAGIAAAPPVPITGLASDSRAVGRGYAFLACRGASRHGVEFADAAVAAGAAAVVWDSATAPATPDVRVPTVAVPGLE